MSADETVTAGDGAPTDVDSVGGETSESIQNILSKTETQSIIKYHIGVFAVVGVGLMLTGVFAPNIGQLFGIENLAEDFGLFGGMTDVSGMASQASGMVSQMMVGMFVFMFTFIVGPLMAAVTSLTSGIRTSTDRKTAVVGATVGAYVGYFLMFAIVIFMSGTKLPLSPDFGGVIINGLKTSIPSGLVAAGVMYLAVTSSE
jgi:hypothetical protein